MSRPVHKTCPTWGVTQCGLERFNTQNHSVTERWRDVTCPKCLRALSGLNRKAYLKIWRKLHAAHILSYSRKWRKVNRPAVRRYFRTWLHTPAGRESNRLRCLKWRNAHRKHVRVYKRIYMRSYLPAWRAKEGK